MIIPCSSQDKDQNEHRKMRHEAHIAPVALLGQEKGPWGNDEFMAFRQRGSWAAKDTFA